MSLFIKEGTMSLANPFVEEWHIGKPAPELKARVVTFQADGDELDLILAAMKRTSMQVIDVDPS